MLAALPEAHDLLGAGEDFRWNDPVNAALAAAEIHAALSALDLGYPHHVEMHLRRAMEVLREDLRMPPGGTPG